MNRRQRRPPGPVATIWHKEAIARAFVLTYRAARRERVYDEAGVRDLLRRQVRGAAISERFRDAMLEHLPKLIAAYARSAERAPRDLRGEVEGRVTPN